jgi:hypothetical protein
MANVSHILPISNKRVCMLLSYRPIRFHFVAENIEISNQTISDFIDIVEVMDEIAIEVVDS